MTHPDDLDDVDPFPADLLEPGESVIVSVSGTGSDRRAMLRPSSAARATWEQHDAMHGLASAALEIRELQAELRERVSQAREVGLSWGLIGFSVGLTAEGARVKYGDRPTPSARSSRRRKR